MADEGGIFLDLMPSLDMAAFDRMFNQIASRATSFGSKLERDLGSAATSGATTRATAQVETAMRSAQASVERSMGAMASASDRQALSAGRLEAANIKLNESIARYGEGSLQAVKAQNALIATQQKAAAASRDLTAAQRESSIATADLARAQSAQEAAMARSSSGAVAAQSAMRAGAVATAAFAVGVGVAAEKAADFQSSQQRLVTSAGESADALKQVSDGLLDMAGQVGYSAQALSTGMYTVESAGYHGAAGLQVMKAAAQGAKAENASLTETTDAVTTALHDYHLGADQSATVMSKMVTAVSQGKTTLQDFASSLSSVQPLAGAAGISIDDLYGSLAAMTSSGMSAQQATQNMADAIRHLQNPTSIMTNELAQVGISSHDLSANLGKAGLAGSMEEISTAIMQKMGPSGQLMLNTFNQSKIAAADADTMFKAMSAPLKNITEEFLDGDLSQQKYMRASRDMTPALAGQAKQWLATYQNAHGFNSMLKAGGSDVQTYSAALAKATGDSSSMNVALMLTGENAAKTNQNINLIAHSSNEAGGNVRGWAETQKTFNQQMSEFKSSLGAAAISIGTDFLPALTNIAHGLADTGRWFESNKWAVDALVIAVGGVAAAFVTFKTISAIVAGVQLALGGATAAAAFFGVGVEGATGATWGFAAALEATGIPEVVIAITALIAAVAAMVVGIIYAYNHVKWFHDAVQDVWGALKATGEWIAHAGVDVWHALETAFTSVVHAVEAVWHAVVYLWHNVFEPAMIGISLAVRYAAAIITAVVIGPIILAFKLFEATAMFLWHNAIEPAMQGIGKAIHWLHDNVVSPVFNALNVAFHWLYDVAVKPVVDLVEAGIADLGRIIHWLHDNVVEPVLHAISDVWKWLYNTVIHPVIQDIETDIHAWGTAFQWVHDSVIKPVGDAIKSVLSGIRDGFKDAVDWIDQQWKRIEGIVGPPVKWIIDTVYNDAIVPVWNPIASVFGLPSINKVDAKFAGGGIVEPNRFAGGGMASGPGIIPGYEPGVDRIHALLSPGESILTPEATRMLGADFIHGINAKSGRPSANAQAGGSKLRAAGGFWGDVGGLVGDAWKGVTGGADLMAKLVSDPAAGIRKLFEAATGKTKDTPGGKSSWKDAITDVPGKVVDGAIDKVKSWFGSHAGAGITGSIGNIALGALPANSAQIWDWIHQAEDLTGVGRSWDNGLMATLMRESGGNVHAINLTDSNAQAGHPSKGLMQTIQTTFDGNHQPGTSSDIYDPVANISAAINYIKSRYHGDINAEAGMPNYSGGGVVMPMYFAGGGIVPTGKSGPQNALDAVLASTAMYSAAGGADLASGVDCSGLVSDAQDVAMGRPGNTRLGNTTSMLAGAWPNLLPGASPTDAFSIGTNAEHMAATILGTNIEARQSGEHIRTGSAAVGAWDKQFTKQFHVDPKVFSPPMVAAAAAGTTAASDPSSTGTSSSTTSSKVTDLQNSARSYTDAANKDIADANAADAAVKKDLIDAANADAQAKTAKTAALRASHSAAAAKYRANADQQKASAAKARDAAEIAKQKAARALSQAQTAAGSSSSTSSDSSSSSGSGSSSSSSSPIMTLHDFGSQVGGIAADGLLETFGLSGTVFADPNQSAILRVGATIGNAIAKANVPKASGDVTAKALAAGGPQKSTIDDKGIKRKVYDDGGMIQPGLTLVDNQSNRPEPVLNYDDKRKLDAAAANRQGADGMKGMVVIENQHVHGGDGNKLGRDLAREMNAHVGGGTR